jgi:alpha-glucosidase
VARKKDGKWYLGAMTDGTPRELEFDMTALGNDFKTITIWQDGVNADKNPMDMKVSSSNVDMKKPVKVTLAPGGGWVAIIE